MSSESTFPENGSVRIALGPVTLAYDIDPATRLVEFSFWPTAMDGRRVEKRASLDSPEVMQLPARWLPMPARTPDPMVQLHVRGDAPPNAFAQGRTLRNSESCAALKFAGQDVERSGEGITVTTRLEREGLEVDHVVRWLEGDAFFRTWTVVRNTSQTTATLDMLASFSFSGITPFQAAEAPEELMVHRIRATWSAEGRLESRLAEELQLERSWTGHAAVSERFGQVGSMPVRGFFPFLAVEDLTAGVLWGARLEHAASWQMEVYRKGDDLCVSGGLADREFGHWWKDLAPGESFESPKAVLTAAAGDLEDLCHALNSAQRRAALAQPASEHELPAIFNEWCSTWGNPTHDHIVQTAAVLAKLGFKYLVIDDGWAERPGDDFQQNGDWIINRKAFPNGLRGTCEAIRAAGLIPGLWFEFEVCNEGSRAWEETSHHLKRDGQILRVGNRRFWDFRDPWTHDYLAEKVIATLRDNGFGYLKIDYNETIGIGCDGAESPGEALRQHIAGVQSFIARIRRELPDVVIENCSSGGHRLEPSMMALCAMGACTDAHETVEIPIIAANLHRVILPRQAQVWAVLRDSDSRQRFIYSLAATFLGRVAISGDLASLADWQRELLAGALEFHKTAVPILLDCVCRRFGERGASMRRPSGWQGVRMVSADGRSMLVVVHAFANAPSGPLRIPLPDGGWRVARGFGEGPDATLADGALLVETAGDFSGRAWILENPAGI